MRPRAGCGPLDRARVGFSLAELAASLALLLGAVLAFGTLARSTARSGAAARLLLDATTAAENRLEEIRAAPAGDLAALDGKEFPVPGTASASGRTEVRDGPPGLYRIAVVVEAAVPGAPRSAPRKGVRLETLRRKP